MPEALVVLPTKSPPSCILVSLIIASSVSENISAPANKKKLEDNLAAYYRKQKKSATPVTATVSHFSGISKTRIKVNISVIF